VSEAGAAGRLWLVVPAAGRGRRMGADRPKQYLTLAGRPVLAHTLARLHQAFPQAQLCLCLDPDDDRFDPAWVPFAQWRRSPGGAERADSVRQALAALADEAGDDDLVLVHDVARPCVTVADLMTLLSALREDPVGALLATPVADTIKRDDGQARIASTEPRDGLWQAQTPQGFRYGLLRRALEQAVAGDVGVTDEASAVEALGLSPRLVPGRRDNLKITHPEDLALAAHVLAAQREGRALHAGQGCAGHANHASKETD
jgi:2-C-methyl-D-erythritol 4-phosphate cytidylyltransferase